MSTRLHHLLLAFCGIIAIALTGCISPRPRNFVDADTLPSDFVGREHRAFVGGERRLVLEVAQTPGLNVVGFDIFEQDGALYVSPRRISSGGAGAAQFEVDVTKYQLGADWPQHVYWLLQSYAYPITNPGFWSREKRSPWPRKKMEIVIR